MKVATVTNIYGHGKILQHSGTSLVLATQELGGIEEIDVYTHTENGEKIEFTKKVRVIPMINQDRISSYFKLYRAVVTGNYDRVLVNSMPTSQGSRNIPNLLYLILPVIWSRFHKIKVSVLYHNSPYLNNVKALGYSGVSNAIRTFIIKFIERRMFLGCNVYFLLRQYADRIKKNIPKAKAEYSRAVEIDGYTTLYLNGQLYSDTLKKKYNGLKSTLLIYGSWGPQKDIVKALGAVKATKGKFNYRIVLAGDVNLHFPNYAKTFESNVKNYKEVIDERIGYIDERELYPIFMNADIIILPYLAPGGFSGVLSISMLFGLDIIVPKFDEYKEQASGYEKVHFIPSDFKSENIVDSIEKIMNNRKYPDEFTIESGRSFQDFVAEVKKMIG